ncbi:hypothetical protein FACS1894169_13480 [Bacteroidia bacterium]|nr:hypothetical protein FACS1894169_13480 [Bacteroidia bacterium]
MAKSDDSGCCLILVILFAIMGIVGTLTEPIIGGIVALIIGGIVLLYIITPTNTNNNK